MKTQEDDIGTEKEDRFTLTSLEGIVLSDPKEERSIDKQQTSPLERVREVGGTRIRSKGISFPRAFASRLRSKGKR